MLIDTKLDLAQQADPRQHNPPTIVANVRVGKEFRRVSKIINWKGYFVAAAHNTLFWLIVQVRPSKTGDSLESGFTFELVHTLDLFAASKTQQSGVATLKDFEFKDDELIYTDGSKIYMKTISLAQPVQTHEESSHLLATIPVAETYDSDRRLY